MRELERGTVRVAFAGNEFLEIVGGTETAFAGTDDNADILRVVLGHLERSILQGAHARDRLELAQVVELAVERHLDAQILVVVKSDCRLDGSAFGLLAGLDRLDVGSLAIAKRAHDTETRHGNLLGLG